VWRFDPVTEQEGYILEPSDCPPEVIAEFQALTGNTLDHDQSAALKEQKINRFNAQMEAQKSGRLY
jgi:hypothetical protein